jgi:hypothetical protein
VPKLSQSHLFQRHDDTALPFLRQRLPNRRRRAFAHRAIQANAPRHSALEIRPSVIRRISSTYQRHCQWHIEIAFKHLKSGVGLVGPPAEDPGSAKAHILCTLLLALLTEPLIADHLGDSPRQAAA